jgi:hypothetical protein
VDAVLAEVFASAVPATGVRAGGVVPSLDENADVGVRVALGVRAIRRDARC